MPPVGITLMCVTGSRVVMQQTAVVLAGAVGAEQPEDLTRVGREAEVLRRVGDADAGPGHGQAEQLHLGAAQPGAWPLPAQAPPDQPLDPDQHAGQLFGERLRLHTPRSALGQR
ncbi:predicted protein [Streptomyces viridochromogenes DSM 40736]|uniref:Predicted protein n=1 Tax=Streptomyces viridochromogenes (strain DSM 40736 / JCM 4977 / BCRC 1201 / Tue 494) TaxID=591159 RepID=D9X606_STRVT|nr:predicted protein [Streptomyces viridochromogenes DSM 40736]